MGRPVPLDEFRREARTWLSSVAAPRGLEPSAWGTGSDSVAVFDDLTEEEEDRVYAAGRTWHRTKFDAGWGALTWPPRHGGRGLSPAHERAFAAEEAGFDVPRAREAITITASLVAPTLDAFGTEEQKDSFIRPFLRGDSLCCQLFSEPGAGSDLAGVSCKATRHGSEWVVNGQKVWTSGARQSDFGMLIARTDPTAPKHAGLTAFLIPLDSVGAEIRPIRQMTGGCSFNEVFLTEVVVPDEARLGEEGAGWRVALTMLGFERGVSGDGGGGIGGSWTQVLALARHVDASRDPVARQELAALYTKWRVLELTNERTRGSLSPSDDPGPVGSISKLFWTQAMTETSNVVARLLGQRLVADTGQWGTYAWSEHVLGAPGYRIAGGSDEIQRNIIGERVLGLPRDPR